MKIKSHLYITIFIFFICMIFPSLTTAKKKTNITNPRLATVKIINTSIRPNYCIPWKMNDYESSTGSGVILKNKLILTNAHVVSDSTIGHFRGATAPIGSVTGHSDRAVAEVGSATGYFGFAVGSSQGMYSLLAQARVQAQALALALALGQPLL